MKFILLILLSLFIQACSQSADSNNTKNTTVLTKSIQILDQAKASFIDEAISGYSEISQQEFVNLFEQTNTISRGLTVKGPYETKLTSDSNFGDCPVKYNNESVIIKIEGSYLYELITKNPLTECGSPLVPKTFLMKVNRDDYILRKVALMFFHDSDNEQLIKYYKYGEIIETVYVYDDASYRPDNRRVHLSYFRINIKNGKITSAKEKFQELKSDMPNALRNSTTAGDLTYTTQPNLEYLRQTLQNVILCNGAYTYNCDYNKKDYSSLLD